MTASTRRRGLNAAGPAPIPQQPNAGTGLSREELRRKHATRLSRPVRYLPFSYRRIWALAVSHRDVGLHVGALGVHRPSCFRRLRVR